MGKVIKFPTHRCRKPSTKDWYTSDKSGWTSNEEMLMRAIADIVTGRVKCKGAALILYHKSCTMVYRRKLTPSDIDEIVENYMSSVPHDPDDAA